MNPLTPLDLHIHSTTFDLHSSYGPIPVTVSYQISQTRTTALGRVISKEIVTSDSPELKEHVKKTLKKANATGIAILDVKQICVSGSDTTVSYQKEGLTYVKELRDFSITSPSTPIRKQPASPLLRPTSPLHPPQQPTYFEELNTFPSSTLLDLAETGQINETALSREELRLLMDKIYEPLLTLECTQPMPSQELPPLSSHEAFGITNSTGTNCFLNATLQMILENQALTRAIVRTQDPKLRALIDFLTSSPPKDPILVRRSLFLISRNLDYLNQAKQGDASECFMTLMNYLVATHPAHMSSFYCLEHTEELIRRAEQTPDGPFEFDETIRSVSEKPIPLYIESSEHSLTHALNSHFQEREPIIVAPKDRQNGGVIRKQVSAKKLELLPEFFCINLKHPQEILNQVSERLVIEASHIISSEPRDTHYELVGFQIHESGLPQESSITGGVSASCGHWLVCRKIQGKYYQISDDGYTELPREDYLAAAQKATTYFFQKLPNRQEEAPLTPSSNHSESPQDSPLLQTS